MHDDGEPSIDVVKPVVAKVVMLGSAGVGKSCIVHRIIHDSFAEHSSTTIGANHHTHMLHISDETVEMRLWDTAGQERFRSFVPLYFRDAAAAVIVFALNDADTFHDAKGWVDMVHNEAGDTVHKFLVGGKSDLKEDRAVTLEEVKAYAGEQGMAYIEASALTGENVAQLFMLIGKEILDHRETLELPDQNSHTILDDTSEQAKTSQRCCRS